ncbi:MAG: flippase [Halobacteriaceae archaeon]
MTDDHDDDIAELASVTHGALVGFSGIALRRVLVFALNFALATGLSVGLYGVYAFGYRVVGLLTRITQLGANNTVVRFVPKHDGDRPRQNRTMGLAYTTVLAASLVAGAALFAAAPLLGRVAVDHPLVTEVVRLFAFLLPFNVLVRVAANQFRSLEMVEYQTAIVQVAEPAARLLGVVVALALGFSVVGVVVAVVCTVATLFVASLALSYRETEIRPAFGWSWEEAREFYGYSLPIAAAALGAVLRGRIDVVLIGALVSASAAGVYNVALLLTAFITFPLGAVNQLFPPVASRLYSEGRTDDLRSVYATIARWIFTGSVAITAVELVYGRQLLSLFGAAYTDGTAVLALFAVAHLVASMVGSTGWLLMMTDNQRVEAVNSWALGVLNVGLSYYFVLEYGVVGAALGTGASLAFINLLRVGELYYLEGLMPFTRKFGKPAAAAVAMTATMYALRFALDGRTLLVVGVALGAVVYAGTLSLLGFEERDRELVGALAARYRGEAAGAR